MTWRIPRMEKYSIRDFSCRYIRTAALEGFVLQDGGDEGEDKDFVVKSHAAVSLSSPFSHDDAVVLFYVPVGVRIPCPVVPPSCTKKRQTFRDHFHPSTHLPASPRSLTSRPLADRYPARPPQSQQRPLRRDERAVVRAGNVGLLSHWHQRATKQGMKDTQTKVKGRVMSHGETTGALASQQPPASGNQVSFSSSAFSPTIA